ncbi:MAG: response regulator [Proteobacteria bacterium]|nr:response regulator [Pseudomonadota bacterium]
MIQDDTRVHGMATHGESQGAMNVLVIDDDLQIRRMMAKLLTRFGYSVLTAADGMEAMKMIELAPPDVVFTDIFMPEMDGFEVMRRFRSTNPNLPVICMSGAAMGSEDFLKYARMLGATDVLYKPFFPKAALNLLCKYLPSSA